MKRNLRRGEEGLIRSRLKTIGSVVKGYLNNLFQFVEKYRNSCGNVTVNEEREEKSKENDAKLGNCSNKEENYLQIRHKK